MAGVAEDAAGVAGGGVGGGWVVSVVSVVSLGSRLTERASMPSRRACFGTCDAYGCRLGIYGCRLDT